MYIKIAIESNTLTKNATKSPTIADKVPTVTLMKVVLFRSLVVLSIIVVTAEVGRLHVRDSVVTLRSAQ